MLEKLKAIVRDSLVQEGMSVTPSQLDAMVQNLVNDEKEYQSILAWIMQKQEACEAATKLIGLSEVLGNEWICEPGSGNIKHISGGFFRIIGVDVQTEKRESGKGWKQPMLDQGTKSSIAGFLRRATATGYQYLVEAKFEPGNYAKVLISPSLQVTFSNLEKAHGGRRPRFAEFFDGSDQEVNCLYEQWLPEDGGRFYLKRVKYMIVELPPGRIIQVDDDFRWVGVNTLKRLLWLDNLVNPHVRSLLAVL